MRYRQIHLDFHTSPVIDDVGTDFDVEDFVKTLKDAHVNSINIFAKCHHGMCYYPTKVGKMHPALKFDLMGTMIDMLHENDIKCPLYFPIGWEEDAATNIDWLEVGRDGIPGHKKPDDASYYSWRKLCLNNKEYRNYIKNQLRELIENYEVDGLWFDIIFQQKCICPECTRDMLSMGLNPDEDKDVLYHDEFVLTGFQKDINDFVAGFNKNISTFYNSSWSPNSGYNNLSIDNRSLLQDHMEIESLPSGQWGYNHFPLFVNYHNRNNGDVIGMNAKFHLSWGDHGSLKNNEALEYECFRMIANGCACSVGDQLHPRGYMNKAAYARIGRVYSEIEKLEKYIEDTTKIADIGVVVSSSFYDKNTMSDEGVMRMLMELKYTFDFIPVTDSFDKYKVIVLPDRIEVTEDLSKKLSQFILLGGRVLATYKSTDIKALGIEYVSDYDYEPSYIVVPEGLMKDVEPLEYVCYKRGAYVKSSLPVMAYVGKPYYNRTATCFSSHMHFPFDKVTDYPAILLDDNVGYCAYPIFDDYITNGNRIYRDVFEYLMENLLKEPSLKVYGPSSMEATLRKQNNRLVLHLLNYIPQRRTKTIDIVDTKLPVYDVKVSVKICENVRYVRMERAAEKVSFSRDENGYINFTIPKVDGYEVITINY